MSSAAHPDAMAPPGTEVTRSAPPQRPSRWWLAPRMRNYLLFDATGISYLLAGFLILKLVWALGTGPEAWANSMALLQSPPLILFHLLVLVSVIYVGIRFFSLFPKAQPPSIGSVKPPPEFVIKAVLYSIWGGVTLVLSMILAGGILP
jgi:fumarate reductase subunit C